MNNEEQAPVHDPDRPAIESRNWREQRRAERMARREARLQRRGRNSYGWIGGTILILLGVVFLLQNTGVLFPANWWALFILIPAFLTYAAAWNSYRATGRVTRGAAASLAAGIFLTALALLFLFNLTLGLFWPILLIAGGLILLAPALLPD
jgi:hypothetical protein